MGAFSYVTVGQAKRHLRVPDADVTHDTEIAELVLAASAAVKNYLGDKSAYLPDYDEDDEPTALDSNYEPLLESFGSAVDASERARPEVKHAVLILVGEFFRNREGEGNFDGNYLPSPVRALLYPLRDPQVK